MPSRKPSTGGFFAGDAPERAGVIGDKRNRVTRDGKEQRLLRPISFDNRAPGPKKTNPRYVRPYTQMLDGDGGRCPDCLGIRKPFRRGPPTAGIPA